MFYDIYYYTTCPFNHNTYLKIKNTLMTIKLLFSVQKLYFHTDWLCTGKPSR